MMMRRRDRKRCPHSNLRAIHGDEINHTPGFSRLQCRDCGRFLDGPVMLATLRAGEVELQATDDPGGRALSGRSIEGKPVGDDPSFGQKITVHPDRKRCGHPHPHYSALSCGRQPGHDDRHSYGLPKSTDRPVGSNDEHC